MSVQTVEHMLGWVERHLEEEPTLEGMAASVGYSACYCSAKFHEYVGISFKEYLARRRLSCAAAELGQPGCRILDVAVRWGFSSHEAFTRAFSRTYGLTPGQYRQSFPTLPGFEKPENLE